MKKFFLLLVISLFIGAIEAEQRDDLSVDVTSKTATAIDETTDIPDEDATNDDPREIENLVPDLVSDISADPSPPALTFRRYGLLLVNSALTASSMGLTASVLPDGNVFIAPLTGALFGGLYTFAFQWDKDISPSFPIYLGSCYGFGGVYGYSLYTLSTLNLYKGRRLSFLAGELIAGFSAYLTRDFIALTPDDLMTIDLSTASAMGVAVGGMLQIENLSEQVFAGGLLLSSATALAVNSYLVDRVQISDEHLINTGLWSAYGFFLGDRIPGKRNYYAGLLGGFSFGAETALLENYLELPSKPEIVKREIFTIDGLLFGLGTGLLSGGALFGIDSDDETNVFIIGGSILGRTGSYFFSGRLEEKYPAPGLNNLAHTILGGYEGALIARAFDGNSRRISGGLVLGATVAANASLGLDSFLKKNDLTSSSSALIAFPSSLFGLGLGYLISDRPELAYSLAAVGSPLGYYLASRSFAGGEIPYRRGLSLLPGLAFSGLILTTLGGFQTGSPPHVRDGLSLLSISGYPLVYFMSDRSERLYLDPIVAMAIPLTAFIYSDLLGSYLDLSANQLGSVKMIGLHGALALHLLDSFELAPIDGFDILGVLGAGYLGLGGSAIFTSSKDIQLVAMSAGLLTGLILDLSIGLGRNLEWILLGKVSRTEKSNDPFLAGKRIDPHIEVVDEKPFYGFRLIY